MKTEKCVDIVFERKYVCTICLANPLPTRLELLLETQFQFFILRSELRTMLSICLLHAVAVLTGQEPGMMFLLKAEDKDTIAAMHKHVQYDASSTNIG